MTAETADFENIPEEVAPQPLRCDLLVGDRVIHIETGTLGKVKAIHAPHTTEDDVDDMVIELDSGDSLCFATKDSWMLLTAAEYGYATAVQIGLSAVLFGFPVEGVRRGMSKVLTTDITLAIFKRLATSIIGPSTPTAVHGTIPR